VRPARSGAPTLAFALAVAFLAVIPQRSASSFALAFLSVIPSGNLLFASQATFIADAKGGIFPSFSRPQHSAPHSATIALAVRAGLK
jgi:hypothetical protein